MKCVFVVNIIDSFMNSYGKEKEATIGTQLTTRSPEMQYRVKDMQGSRAELK